jgi:hypothetical protein
MIVSKTIFNKNLSDPVPNTKFVSKQAADQLFRFFKQCPLFRWQDANNDCEDRANAACILLEKWNIPNCKAWVFGGTFLKKGAGSLVNCWNYHVAATIPVKEENGLNFFVLDPAMLNDMDTIENWANQVTGIAYSYHLVKYGSYYIFNHAAIEKDNWHERDKQNYKWTIQGLSGINGVSQKGKAQLVFNKFRIKRTDQAFQQILKEKSPLNLPPVYSK